MKFVKLHTTEHNSQSQSSGSINQSKVEVEIFENEDKIAEKIFLCDNHLVNSNWTGDKTVIWAYILKELGYKLNFTFSLDIYSDAIDFIPQIQSFHQEDFLQSIPVHVVYERDFYAIGLGKTAFKDQPKEFNTQINGTTLLIQSQNFETIYETVVKHLSQVYKLKINPEFELYEKPEY